MRNTRHVVPHVKGWAVLKPDCERASAVFGTKSAAVNRGRAILRSTGGGELVIHRQDGRMQTSVRVTGGRERGEYWAGRNA